MNKPKELTFKVKFANIRKDVIIKVWCKKQFAITWMSNADVLKRMYEVEKENGNNLIKYDDNKKIIVQKFPHKTATEIEDIITKEITTQGGKEE